MFKVDDNSLKQYPALQRYLAASDDFAHLLSPADYDATYVIEVVGDFKNAKKRDFCLLEICVMMGLKRHIDDIKANTDILPQIERRQYRAFRLAIANEALDIAELLIQLSLDEPVVMIRPYNYRVFKYAVESGNRHLVRRLISISGEDKERMFASHGYQGLNIAIEKSFEDILFDLLKYPANFNYAAKHPKCHDALSQFVHKYMSALPIEPLNEQDKQLILSMITFILDSQKNRLFLEDKSSLYLGQLVSYPDVNKLLKAD